MVCVPFDGLEAQLRPRKYLAHILHVQFSRISLQGLWAGGREWRVSKGCYVGGWATLPPVNFVLKLIPSFLSPFHLKSSSSAQLLLGRKYLKPGDVRKACGDIDLKLGPRAEGPTWI